MTDEHIPAPPNASALLASAGLRPKKSWGQNFLHDQSVLMAIAASAGVGPDRPVVELGAGLGALTYYLCRSGGRVIAVERDRELVPLLRESLSWYENLDIREADAATLDYAELAQELGGPFTVVGNLPYQLSSRILVSLAEVGPHIAGAVLLVQLEVAARLAAPPGGREYGLLSVLVGRSFDVELHRRVRPGAFLPPPKVHSAVVRLTPSPLRRSLEQDSALVATARAAFSRRRKTLRNSLSGGLGQEPPEVEAAIHEAGLDPRVRAETLSIEAFHRLGAVLSARGLLLPKT